MWHLLQPVCIHAREIPRVVNVFDPLISFEIVLYNFSFGVQVIHSLILTSTAVSVPLLLLGTGSSTICEGVFGVW